MNFFAFRQPQLPRDVKNHLHELDLWAAFTAAPSRQRRRLTNALRRAKDADSRKHALRSMISELRACTTYLRMAYNAGDPITS